MRGLVDAKLLKFLTVGALNTLIGTAIMFGLYNLAGCSYWVSSAANYILVSILSYGLNKRFTFRHQGRVLNSGLKFACNIALCYLAAYGVAKPLALWIMSGSSLRTQENIAMLAGMCIFTGLNYLGQRFFVFGEKEMEYQMEYQTNYRKWLNSPYLEESEKAELAEMTEEEVREAFYKDVEFGTAGMRGIMGLGTNRINKYTVRMAAKGLALLLGPGSKVAIAYDTRNRSEEFAREAAGVLAASGIEALLLDRYSPVPLLSFAVRELKCDGGIVITASHNTREYNGFKVYDETGCQMKPEPAGRIAEHMASLKDPLAIGTCSPDHENIQTVGPELVRNFLHTVQGCGAKTVTPAMASKLQVIYTPLHGSGRDYVLNALREAGLKRIVLLQEQSDFNGQFPTVEKPNPEDPAAFTLAEKEGRKTGADLLIATDPDCDRIGVAIKQGDQYVHLTGNQIGALLIDFLARQRDSAGKTLITTIVTGEMGPIIARSYGIKVVKTLTGFKYIGSLMNGMNPADFFMAYEESYGYLAGTHARDKDGVSAALLVCQMAACYKDKNLTLIDRLHQLYEKHGYWLDHQESFTFEGVQGEQQIRRIMEALEEAGEDAFTEIPEAAEGTEFLDYNRGIDGLPSANVLKFQFKDGSWLAARPSGTEPKIKFYYCIRGKNRQRAENLHRKLQEKVSLFTKSFPTK